MIGIKRQFTDGPNDQIHLRVAGEVQELRQPLMCLHMCPISSVEFAPLLELMGASRRVIAQATELIQGILDEA